MLHAFVNLLKNFNHIDFYSTVYSFEKLIINKNTCMLFSTSLFCSCILLQDKTGKSLFKLMSVVPVYPYLIVI